MRILFFRLGAIGDAILTTPAVRKARELFPDAEIHYLAGEAAAEVLENNPHIDRLFTLKKVKTFLPRDFEALAQAGFLRENFGKTGYDYFIDFESNPFSTVLSFFIKAGRKIGHLIRRKRKFMFNLFYDTRVDHKDGDFYIIHRHLALIKELGQFTDADKSLVYRVSGSEKEQAAEFYESTGTGADKLKIMLNISSTWQTKAWPREYWVRLAEMISGQVWDVKIIVLWAPGGSEELKRNLEKINNTILIPETTLRQMAAIMSLGDVLVSTDSAVRHIGAALGLRTIGLFGPTTEKGWAFPDEKTLLLTAPRELCAPCHRADCRDGNGCMDRIKPEAVFEAVKNLLSPQHPI